MSAFWDEVKPGDLIEIFRLGYQHWALYVGNGYIVHLAPPSEVAGAGPSSMMSLTCDKAVVKRERLRRVAGDDRFRVNNALDRKRRPRPAYEIVKDAESLVGKWLEYSVVTSNCEHFVNELRYGTAESLQVQDTVTAVVTATVVLGAVGAMVSLFSNRKERNNKKW
ncbi:phospholipase A and acyltransferase 3-like [Lepisosteus oculatus]|uniref:Retinoic acid receptor responder 3 n=1 Tax=Lepisosteus oculatus TaxID=7918 RepID=W5M0T1_LEPOC|nr:PREDICTED: HRAS-like suppressor 3 [Lepisosteus oculatus]XP_015194302.1 PREDICTED: HRAS-like suppressor 3 [Lepisosteus oculatus]XP_015194303.1 PREDICTED: HRAS-like suppressor 3 [Lepisosteus oculatus]XP_015194304.1 PREDICTED: HRAS-like suppressor 3 [Lepisosteus oculatus]